MPRFDPCSARVDAVVRDARQAASEARDRYGRSPSAKARTVVAKADYWSEWAADMNEAGRCRDAIVGAHRALRLASEAGRRDRRERRRWASEARTGIVG